MLANIGILLALSGAIIGSLDVLLSDKQKGRILECSLWAWSVLDDWKEIRPEWLITPRTKFWVSLSGSVGAILYALYRIYRTSVAPNPPIAPNVFWPAVLFLIAVSSIFAIWLGERILRYVLKTNARQILLRAYILAAPFLSFLAFAYYVYSTNLQIDSKLDAFLTYPVAAWAAFSIVLMSFFLMLTMPLSIAVFAFYVLTAMEYVVRRIAEHPKGPVIAAGILIAAALGLLKALGYA